jgi:valyl-tRNA synthetase
MKPFTPFLSQELQRHLPIISDFEEESLIDQQLELNMERILELVANIRQVKSQSKITRKHEPVGEFD